MKPGRKEEAGISQARIIPLTRYLRRRGREPDGDPVPPAPAPVSARKPPPPVVVEAISAQVGGAPRVAHVRAA